MLSEKSIKKTFIIQLTIASALLVGFFSYLLYTYIKVSMLKDISNSLVVEAEQIAKKSQNIPFAIKTEKDRVKIVAKNNREFATSTEYTEKDGKKLLTLYYPYDKAKNSFVVIKKDITGTYKLFSKILSSIIVVNLFGILLILGYAFTISGTLLYPIKDLNKKLSRMNENFLEHINTKELPIEFISLAESINKLIDRIENFLNYQKDLFLGASHELRTPLTVMKSRNEVTLIKERDAQKYIETLKVNNKAIDEMNAMITSIMEIGRQESAHFEEPIEVNVVEFLEEKGRDYRLLSSNKNVNIKMDLEPERYCIITQPTLLNHVVQNFVQNAIKFSPENSEILIKSRLNGDDFKVEIIDEGPGIDEDKDLFAPFKRYGNKSGAGLGLFLAKGAANAIGGKLTLKNRIDGKSGTIATIELNAKNFCPMDDDTQPYGRKSVFSKLKG